MKKTVCTLLLLSCCAAAQQAPQSAAAVYHRTMVYLEQQLVQAAEAMDEERFSWKPSPEVFTFGQQAKHIAVNNYLSAARILDAEPPAAAGEAPKHQTKAEIITYLKESFAYVRSAMETLTPENLLDRVPATEFSRPSTRLAVTNGIIAHGWNHYGQMTQYLRQNAIVPPASRR